MAGAFRRAGVLLDNSTMVKPMNSSHWLCVAALGVAAAAALPPAQAAGDPHAGHATAASPQTPWGAAASGKPTRTIAIRMSDDMRFRPDRIEVREGETVRLVIRNAGKILHELVLGTPAELKQHAALMKKSPAMAHGDPSMTHVKPGATGELAWNFNRPGTFQFACLIPGHFEAGMVGTVVVTPRAP